MVVRLTALIVPILASNISLYNKNYHPRFTEENQPTGYEINIVEATGLDGCQNLAPNGSSFDLMAPENPLLFLALDQSDKERMYRDLKSADSAPNSIIHDLQNCPDITTLNCPFLDGQMPSDVIAGRVYKVEDLALPDLNCEGSQ